MEEAKIYMSFLQMKIKLVISENQENQKILKIILILLLVTLKRMDSMEVKNSSQVSSKRKDLPQCT